jgi:hypothetical protein
LQVEKYVVEVSGERHAQRASQKNSGLFCMGGNIYMTIGWQLNQATGGMGTNTA